MQKTVAAATQDAEDLKNEKIKLMNEI